MHKPAPTDAASPPPPISERAAVAWLCSPVGRREADEVALQLPLSAAQLQRLRNRIGRLPAEWLIATAALRKPAEEKFGIDGLLVTDRALQQSTDRLIADYKASHFPRGVLVWDLCCGIGGDAIGLARRGPLIAVDRDPVVCRLAAHNLARSGATSAAVVCQAIDPQSLPEGSWFHIDPDRRPGERRVADPQHSEPPPSTIDALMDRAAGGAIKLAPAADVSEHWSRAGAREWISRGGSCRQQIVWLGTTLPAASRAATTVGRDGTAHTFVVPDFAVRDLHSSAVTGAAAPLAWIFDFDPAIRAAGLTEVMADRLDLQTLGGPAGFLTADRLPNPDEVAPALYQAFEVLWQGPMDGKKLRRWVAEHEATSLEIKMRGVELTPEVLRKRLLPKMRPSSGSTSRPTSNRAFTLLIGRAELGGRVYAAVAERWVQNEHV